MHILLCSLSSALGGVERRLEAECRLLVQSGHRVTVATPRFTGFRDWRMDIARADGEWIFWQPYKFVERRHFAAPFRWLAMLSRSILRSRNIDFAHLALPWSYVGMSMAAVLTSMRVPFVVSVHCKSSGRPLPERGRILVREALQCLVGGYAVSEPAMNTFLHQYAGLLPGNASLQVIFNGIDPERFRADVSVRQAMRRTLGIGDDAFVVLFCGRLDPMKRPLMALRVFSGLLGHAPGSRLLVVGDGPQMDSVRSEIRRLALDGHVIVTGRVPDTAPYYAASDCYLSTSTNGEGCPLAPSEALSSGLPAIVPDDDVFRAVYGECPAVFPQDPNREQMWISGLLSVASATGARRRQWAVEGRDHVVRALSLDLMKRRLAAFYEQVLSVRGNA